MSNLSKKQITVIIIISCIFFIVIGGYLYSVYSSTNEESLIEGEDIVEESYEQKSIQSEKVIVHIAGEVNNPGIIEVEEGSRIADIVEMAEGFTNTADVSKINLAYVVQDGQKITIPSTENLEEKTEEDSNYIIQDNAKGVIEESTQKEKNVGIVNINKATQTELEQLPGIGTSTALKIVEYRKTNKFKTIEDIKNVSGIGEAKFDKIKDYITI